LSRPKAKKNKKNISLDKQKALINQGLQRVRQCCPKNILVDSRKKVWYTGRLCRRKLGEKISVPQKKNLTRR